MAFFIKDQQIVLDQLHHSSADHGAIIEFCQSSVDQLLGERIAPLAAENDRQEIFAVENFPVIGEIGLISLYAPEEFGGMDACFSYYNACLESLAKADSGFALGVAIHGTCCDGLLRFASQSLKERYLPDLLSGRKVAAFALSEPDSGSDAKAMKTSYRKDGDRYLLNGSKYWITNGMTAENFFTLARGPEGQVSAFLVNRGGDGTFEQHKIADKMGVRGSNTAELTFRDHAVSADHMIGGEGDGFRYAMQMLNGGRVTISSWSIGVAQGAYDKLIKYAHERELFGGLLRDLDNIKRELAEMYIEISASRHLSYAAAFQKSKGADIRKIAAAAKFKASETAVHVAQRAIELAGGYGYVMDSRIERHLRDALLGRIGEGANELISCVVIPRVLYKEYEERPIDELW